MLLAALLTLANAATAAPMEMRGLWVVRTGLVSPEAVDRVVDDAARAGFNAVFAQVRGRCDAFYPSALSPRSALLQGQPAAFDPLARVLWRARARGLAVHAWVNVLLCAPHDQPLPPGHVLRRHPGAAMLARSSGPTDAEGLYLSPSAPGVPEHLEAVVRELVRAYAVDGLHLDYIRYPGPDYDHSPAALDGLARHQRLAGEPPSPPSLAPQAWADYRRSTLTALAGRLARAARQERPGITVSAAVVPDEALAVRHKYQDWPAWTLEGILDAVSPMAYSADARVFRRQLDAVVARARGRRAVWAGIGAYRLSLAGMAGHVREARAAGASGVILFSHEWLLPSDAGELRAAFALRPPAPRPPA
ncbi:MAG TPA: family 10 glycosylhydrolase, partial [Vicinamibacteria bacterium]|nr:family 10 glycosylhydrolase [Vicinamibacteria bacterium]